MKTKNIERKNIDKLLENTETLLIGTDNGIGIVGNRVNIMATLSALVSQLKEDGMSETDLNIAFKVGLNSNITSKKSPKDKEIDDEIKGFVKDLLKGLKKDLDKMLGDE